MKISNEIKVKARIQTAMFLAVAAVLITSAKVERKEQSVTDAHYCEMVQGGFWGAYRTDIKCDNLQAAK